MQMPLQRGISSSLIDNDRMMMIEKIKAHNEVNGFVFSTIELAAIAFIILPFALYYLTHGRALAGILTIGVVANALTVAAFGVHSLATKQKDIGIFRWFDRKGRAIIALRYPNITADTFILAAATLVPFLLLLYVAYELTATHMPGS